ncbi:MAG: IGHMBP2 family helicase [Planctomycetes bacterium]|nr:IGHMBP2 family helicase [Planctomycetota bacterium]
MATGDAALREPPDLDAFVRHHRELLALERRAEIDEAKRMWDELDADELERRGVTLLRMTVVDHLVGLGGRPSLVLQRSRGGVLPSHRITAGDVVALRTAAEHGGLDGRGDASGVVAKVTDDAITVSLDDAEDEPELPDLLRIDRVAPDVTFRRLDDALRELGAARPGPSGALREIAFGDRTPSFDAQPDGPDRVPFVDPGLDASQRAAVVHALRARDIALIHGPPGTGKTTALVEVIRQSIKRGLRVLATAPSNVAVDNLVERLHGPDVRLVRLGHPARLLPQVVEHALDAQLERGPDAKALKSLRRDVEKLQRRLDRATARDERRQLRGDIRSLRREIRRVETGAIQGILDTADVICATTTGAATSLLRERDFGLVVVDEAAQAIEAGAWIPLLRGRRAVLVGDHRQLPPTIVSQAAADGGLARTLFERLDARHGADVTRMLTVQYRMHAAIMQWASAAMYDGRLEAAPAVAGHLLADLPHVVPNDLTGEPLVLIDTAGCGFDETEDAQDRSKANPGEARLVVAHVEALLAAGVRPSELAVITPYNAQVELLRRALRPRFDNLEIGTVDGFQGREKEAVVLSAVRSNDRGEIGFLAEPRRMNVAVTRARRHVTLVADSATLASDAFLAGLLEHFRTRGVHRTPWDLGYDVWQG